MNSNSGEGQAHVGYFVNPLIISGAGIICSCVALATYHFILFRLCLQSRQRLQHMPHPTSPPAYDISYGVDPEVLKRIPILPYSHKKGGAFRLDQTECAICLGELLEGEKVRLLPSCAHAFHIFCIDLWFDENSNCPICRAPLVITPSQPSPPRPVASETVADVEGIRVFRVQSDRQVFRVQSDLSIIASSSTSRSGAATLQHTLSVAYRHNEQEKPQDSMTGMRRSLSMDHSPYVSVHIERDEEHKAAVSSSSSSSPSVVAGIGIVHAKTLDQVSSMLMMSFAQFRNSRNDGPKGILPN